MTPLETNFRIPIRIFDPITVHKAEKEMEKEYGDPNVFIPHVVGIASIPYNEAKNMMYLEGFLPNRPIDEVEEEGFDSVILLTPTMGNFTCAMKLQEFETVYAKYLKEMEAYIDARNMEYAKVEMQIMKESQ